MKVKIRQAKIQDIPQILSVEKGTWGEECAASKEMLESRLKIFPEGFLVAESDGDIIGLVVVERVNYDFRKNSYTWYQITDNGFIKNSHRPDGNVLYGVDLSVLPAFQRKGVGSKLLEAVAKLAVRFNIKQGMLGGRLPDYHKYAEKMSPEEYLYTAIRSKDGERPLDPEVTFYKKAGLKIVKIIPDYFKDSESLNYGVLLLWENPFFNKWYRWIIVRFFRI